MKFKMFSQRRKYIHNIPKYVAKGTEKILTFCLQLKNKHSEKSIKIMRNKLITIHSFPADL